jgi:hypothetical protein
MLGRVAGVSEHSPPNWYKYFPSDEGHSAPNDTAGGPSGGKGAMGKPVSGGEAMLKGLERSKVRK